MAQVIYAELAPEAKRSNSRPSLRFALVISMAVLATLPACQSARVNQFEEFSKVGGAYVEAADAVFGEARRAVIKESSDTLMLTRSARSMEQRKQDLESNDARDLQFLAVLKDIQKHNRLLRDYFAALGALAESDAPTEIGTSAQSVYGALAKLSPEIEKASIGGSAIKDLIKPAIKMIVAAFRHAALEKELNDRAALIERELALQDAAMQAVAEGLKARLVELNTSRKAQDVDLPYIQDGTLPKKWAERRYELLDATSSSEAATAAADAASKLRLAFQALVRNEFSAADLQLILQDIGEVLELIELLKKD